MARRESDSIISGDGDIFDGQHAVGRAHVEIRLPRAPALTAERRTSEQTGSGRRMGKIRFDGETQLGPPIALIGKPMSMRLDDGRTLDFILFDGGTIQVLRVME